MICDPVALQLWVIQKYNQFSHVEDNGTSDEFCFPPCGHDTLMAYEAQEKEINKTQHVKRRAASAGKRTVVIKEMI